MLMHVSVALRFAASSSLSSSLQTGPLSRSGHTVQPRAYKATSLKAERPREEVFSMGPESHEAIAFL